MTKQVHKTEYGSDASGTMATGYQTLTEREKQTLRLLMGGHDAKSMANHLGLSVHTINERLRDARRKLEVSSSREAARQLHQLESHTPAPPEHHAYHPDLSVRQTLRDAEKTETADNQSTPANGISRQQRTGWAIGGVFMSFTFALLALASLSSSAETHAALAPVPDANASVGEIEAIAAPAARDWLAIVDTGNWNASWDATGQAFKSLNTSAKWAAASEQVRRPLGSVTTRTLIHEAFVPAPPYGYRIVRFKTHFTNKPDAVETLSLSREAEQWRVVGYIVD